jgi:tetratricopeptide (TPR) repeat protein
MSARPRAVAPPAEPFWQRIPSIALYPARGAALMTLIALALASLLRVIPFIGGIVSILVWLAAYKYAFEILRRTADGYMDPPEVELSIDDGVVWRFVGMQVILAGALVACAVIAGAKAGLLALVVLGFLQPGMTMTLAMSGSMTAALNPANALSLVARVGFPYFAVFGLLFVIQASALIAGVAVARAFPLLGPVVLMFALCWAMFSAFHLMGYLLYQSHESLGFQPDALRDDARPMPGAPAGDALLRQVEPLLRDGKTDEALALLRGEVRTRAVTDEAHEVYRRLLKQSGDTAAVQDHARQFLHSLMTERQDRRALGLLRESLDADPTFVPADSSHAERLAELARLGGQSQLALDAYQALMHTFPGDAHASQWALHAAMLLVDRFGRDADAKALLEQARERATDPAMVQKIDATMKAIGPA